MSKHEERLQQFADELIKKIEANEAPWQKGWVSGLGDILPVNHQGKPYRGNNLLDLMMIAQAKGYNDNRWYTFNNAKDYGGHVRRGEKGTVITFFSRTKTENKRDEQGNTIYDKDGKPEKVTYVLDRPIITTAVVFNAEQIDGLPPRELTTPLSEWERIERAEAIAQGIESQGVTIEHRLGDRAYYSPTDDKIVMPERGQFSTPDAYYATLLHEIGHATGHESRLNRDLSGGFGSESYAKEELRAEIASMIVGEQLQIGYDPSQHHAYLKSWAKVIKEDPKEILRAVKDADAISEYVIGLGKEIEATKESQQSKYTDEQLLEFSQFLNGEPVATITSGQIKRDEDGKVVANAKEYMRQWLAENRPDGIFHHPKIGEINLFVRGVKDSISHYGADIHVNALPAVPYVLENSVIIDKSNDKDGKNIENYVLASPITIDNENYYAVVRLKKELDKDKNPKFYIVSAETETEAQKNAVLTLETRSTHDGYIAGGKNRLLNILHETLAEVKLWENRNQARENQYETTTKNYRTEQQSLHSTSQTDREARTRVDSLQQSRGGLLQESISTSSQNNQSSNRLNSQATDKRLYLYTCFNDLNDLRKLKEQGIVKFDTQNKVWYANEQNKDAVARWIVRPNVPSPEQEFADYLTANGITVEAGHPIFDDKTHRLSNNGSTDKNVMYQAYANPNGVPFARVTNFSRGDVPENWQYPKEYLNTLRNIEAVERAKGSSYKPSSPTLSVNNPVQPTLSPKERDEAKIAKANEMAEISKVIVSISDVAPPTQNYLSNKQVTANDTVLIVPHSSKLSDEFKDRVMIADTFKQAKYYRENNPDEKLILQRGNLVVPQYNTQGELRAFETIAYNGGKYALKDADKKGLMTTLGNLENGKPIIITEGYATGATLHEHTRKDKPTVVVVFGRGGLMEVTQALRENYPDSKIYIGADNDHQKPLEIDPATGRPKVNQGLEDAKAVADVVSNVHLLVPQFSRGDTGKDWNDVYVDKGEKEFKRQIIEQLNSINRLIEQDKEKSITQLPIEAAKEPTQKQSLTIYERLSTDVIKQNYPTMPENTLKGIEIWLETLPTQYANEPLKLQFALERLESKLPDYVNGEALPLPKIGLQQVEPPDKGVIR